MFHLHTLYTPQRNYNKVQEQIYLLCHVEYILYLHILVDMNGNGLTEIW
jgi:hypothetical protein